MTKLETYSIFEVKLIEILRLLQQSLIQRGLLFNSWARDRILLNSFFKGEVYTPSDENINYLFYLETIFYRKYPKQNFVKGSLGNSMGLGEDLISDECTRFLSMQVCLNSHVKKSK